MSNWVIPTIITIPTFINPSGSLGVIEGTNEFPFEIKRVYFLHDIPAGAIRGSHAHKNLFQLIIPLSGRLTVTLDDAFTKRVFELESANQALTVPPGYWRTLSHFSEKTTALVLASEKYTPSDYIRNYEEFLAWASNR
jgi:dTDP-4-dehydrorhamnose 3,5-epimerase-like enzyme